MQYATEEFRATMIAHGLNPPTVITPGKFLRFPGLGKASINKAGWCKLFDDCRGGIFGDHSSGISEHWQPAHEVNFTESEREAFRAKVAENNKRRDAHEAAIKATAAAKAKAIWGAAQSAPADFPYLVHKRIKPHIARIYNGSIVIPLCADGEIKSLQFIDADGGKRFLTGGQKKGSYCPIGEAAGADALCICEGFATGATIHEATGRPVAISLDAGNLLTVATAMRSKFPGKKIIICADNDWQTHNNPGVTKSSEAASAIGGYLAVPVFERYENGTA